MPCNPRSPRPGGGRQRTRRVGMNDDTYVEAAAGLTRAELLKRGAVAGAGLTVVGSLAAPAFGADVATQTVRWISPRGTLDVMDDYNLWVPIHMGYFKNLGINAKLIAGPIGDALASTKFVAQHQADMGYPSP